MQVLTAVNSVCVLPRDKGVNALAAFAQRSSAEVEGRERNLSPNEWLYHEGDPAERAYTVLRGVVRCYNILPNGRRKIQAFRLSGELFGWDSGAECDHSAEAVNEVSVRSVRRAAIMERAANDPDARRNLWSAIETELQRVRSHALLLAKCAPQRVACFLIEMSRRCGGTRVLELPMSRQEIADYLGLTIETVSRTVSQLQDAGFIELTTSRQILLRNVDALRRMEEDKHIAAVHGHKVG